LFLAMLATLLLDLRRADRVANPLNQQQARMLNKKEGTLSLALRVALISFQKAFCRLRSAKTVTQLLEFA
jgi:hypothetical protein